jgi:lipopolysaccharide export system protein LptC
MSTLNEMRYIYIVQGNHKTAKVTSEYNVKQDREKFEETCDNLTGTKRTVRVSLKK